MKVLEWEADIDSTNHLVHTYYSTPHPLAELDFIYAFIIIISEGTMYRQINTQNISHGVFKLL